MDRRKLIAEVIDRYQDKPDVMSDIKRVVKLMESYFRDFTNRIMRS